MLFEACVPGVLVQAGKDAAQLFALFIAPGFVDERLDPGPSRKENGRQHGRQ